MSEAYERALYGKVETIGYVRGKTITSHYSFPAGITYDELNRMIDAHERAFGHPMYVSAVPLRPLIPGGVSTLGPL